MSRIFLWMVFFGLGMGAVDLNAAGRGAKEGNLRTISDLCRRQIEAAAIPGFPSLAPILSDGGLLLEAARAQWRAGYEPERLRYVLDLVARNGKNGVSKAERKFLKHVRQRVNLLKSAAVTFLVAGPGPGLLPEEFSQFGRELGRLNDLIKYGQRDDKIRAQAAVVQLWLGDDLEVRALAEPKLVSEKTVRRRIDESLAAAEKSLEKKKTTIADFHEVRKSLRHIRNLIQLALHLRRGRALRSSSCF